MWDSAHAGARQQEAESGGEEAQQLRSRVQDPSMVIRLVGVVAVLTVTFMVFVAGIAETDPAASLRTRLGQEPALGVSLLLLVVIVTAAARFVGRHERLR
ncbi:hypothetical protein Franean1_3080 [Parafrankia sp. EAN1pec]|uniref:hypothetical protein n=1 Tax=Parafrankia sp. (strain EAN1pec) TaxID=298653 RepID=UPI0000541012|nr:hypothetical protein Franean1_3080 [Frankia sp. EAN1pec]